MKIKLTILLVLTFAFTAIAQSSISNNEVVEMVKTGLSPAIIVAKIRASKTKFDTSTEALKFLADAKVPDEVIVAIIEKQQHAQELETAGKKQSADSQNSIAEQGTLKDITGKKKVFIFVNDVKSRDFIAKELSKSDLTVVDKIEDSDFAIKYEDYIEDLGASVSIYGNSANVNKKSQRVGTLTVVMPSENGKRLRLIYSARKTEYWRWDDNPAKSTAKQFLKDLNKSTESK